MDGCKDGGITGYKYNTQFPNNCLAYHVLMLKNVPGEFCGDEAGEHRGEKLKPGWIG